MLSERNIKTYSKQKDELLSQLCHFMVGACALQKRYLYDQQKHKNIFRKNLVENFANCITT